MYATYNGHPCAKLFYHPIDAAIRWCELMAHEAQIQEAVWHRGAARLNQALRQWPGLQATTETIFDALRNGELPYGCMGVSAPRGTPVDHWQLTIRHTDLKAWMSRFHPEHKPAFLFDELERISHPSITLDTVLALQADRDALRTRLAESQEAHRAALQHNAQLQAQLAHQVEPQESAQTTPSDRSERTYLNIIGALLALLLGRSPAGIPFSSFCNQTAVISSIIAHHPGRLGITERTLERKFAAAKRSLNPR